MGYETNDRAPFWQSGFGCVNLPKAVALVRRRDFARAIMLGAACGRQEGPVGFGHSVPRSDWWTFDAPRVALQGSDTREFTVTVRRGSPT